MGALDPTQYDSATNAFHKAIATPTASLALRSQATVKLGMVKEQLARIQSGPEKAELLDAALNHYLNVVYGQIPGAEDLEAFDPYWVKEAGLAAARVTEEFGQWDVALNLYQRMTSLFPPLEPMLAKRADRIKELRAAPRGIPK
jgi:hypothetical protein